MVCYGDRTHSVFVRFVDQRVDGCLSVQQGILGMYV